jgi:hypothetical protein
MKKFLTILLFLFISFSLFSLDGVKKYYEIMSIDKAVQGIWDVYGTSQDYGITVHEENGFALCKVTGSKIITNDGETLKIEHVYYLELNNGTIANLVYFAGKDFYWAISKEDPPWILVQVFNVITNKEGMRFLVRQEE